MRIVHIFWSFTVGGAETMVVDIINKQIDEGDEVALFIINNNYSNQLLDKIDAKTKLILINRVPGSKSPFPIIKLNILLLLFSPTTIHCHNHSINKILLNSLLRKSVLTVHGFLRPIKPNHRFKKIVAISSAVKKDLSLKGISKINTVYNGISIESITIKEKFNSDIQIVCIGRLEHLIKGQDILIKAFFELKKNYHNVKLHFIGEGKSERHLILLIKQLNLEDDVIIHQLKSREEIYNSLKEYDILVQPSIHEGFGLTVIEGMVAKLPIIISNALGLLEITKNGEFVQDVINNPTPEMYCNSLVKVIDKIKNKTTELKNELEKSREYVIHNFSIQNTVTEYRKIYKSFKT